jgi:heat-inducible transcriptional repressor
LGKGVTPTSDRTPEPSPLPLLSPRQAQVLRALVRSYVGEPQPVGSETLTRLLPMSLSAASVRTTLAELAALGLLEKTHRSAGRRPTELGFRVYVDQLDGPLALGDWERRLLSERLEGAPEGRIASVAARLLSERTRQLGFVEAPRLERVVLRHVSFVRVSAERVLVVLVAEAGQAYQRLVDQPGRGDQAELDRMATALSERVAGRTLREVRDRLVSEAAALRSHAEWLLERALRPGSGEGADALEAELVIATRLALLEQPEFHEPGRIRELFEAVEDRERLAAILAKVLDGGRVRVTFGGETGEPALRHCALVAAPYGPRAAPFGALGVIGPCRMDYARVIPFVETLSQLISEKLQA